MKKLILFTSLLIATVIGFSQTKFPVADIAENMKKNADAIVRVSEENVLLNDRQNLVYQVHYAITILNKAGEKYAQLEIPYDKSSKISDISGAIFDKNGKLVKKLKNSEINDVSYYEGLYSDNRVKYAKPLIPNFPYTVEYSYEIQSFQTLFIPDWNPIGNFRVSVENASYNITNSSTLHLRFLENKFTGKHQSVEKSEIWSLMNFEAIEREELNNNSNDYFPRVYPVTDNFSMDGNPGNFSTWQNFGLWCKQLSDGLDILPEESVKKIKNLVANVSDDKEKARILYEYMQSKTHYVSIQVGIGKFQPFSAETVDRNGYGDCKALSNYMNSILKVAGINSYYTLVSAGTDYKPMNTDFPISEFNHAMLCIPFKNDTTWLECTSQYHPFGYIGDFTVNRNVLLITDEGGKIAHTKSYKTEDNTQNRKIEAQIDSAGNAVVTSVCDYRGLLYEDIIPAFIYSKDDIKKNIESSLDLQNVKINSFDYQNYKSIMPSAVENLNFTIKNYASLSQTRLFLPLNILNKHTVLLKKIENRKTDIIFHHGHIEYDTVYYLIPPKYKPEIFPESVDYSTVYGNYHSETLFSDGKVTYIRRLQMNAGTYPPEKYNEIKDFYKSIYDADKKNCVLIREM